MRAGTSSARGKADSPEPTRSALSRAWFLPPSPTQQGWPRPSARVDPRSRSLTALLRTDETTADLSVLSLSSPLQVFVDADEDDPDERVSESSDRFERATTVPETP